MTEPPVDHPSRRKAHEMVARFLSLAGVEDPELSAEAERVLHAKVDDIHRHGLRESDLAVMGQAYIRAVGRVVAAEAEALSSLRPAVAPGDGSDPLDDMVDRMQSLGRDVFDVLHGVLLRRVATGDPARIDRSRRSRTPTAVAHVDVIASTALLQRATLSSTQRLVDGLFAAAQAAIRGRGVEVSKYVGDGVFLVGPEPMDVALASLHCIAALERDAGLRSRAGLAFGSVLHRAGDVFGLPVNLSHLLTKSADQGSLLATAVAPAALPASMCGQPRTVTVRGLDAPLEAFELLAETT